MPVKVNVTESLDLPELINSELSLNFPEVTGEIFLKPIEKQLQKVNRSEYSSRCENSLNKLEIYKQKRPLKFVLGKKNKFWSNFLKHSYLHQFCKWKATASLELFFTDIDGNFESANKTLAVHLL